jgi:hypothetical protein
MNDTLIFLVLAGLALIFKWLTSQGSGAAEKPKAPLPNEPIQRAPPESEEERVRRFLEALGVPPGTQAPLPVRPRTITPRPVATPAARPPPPKVKRSGVYRLPPLVTTPEDVSLPPLTSAPPAPEPVFMAEAQPAPAPATPPPLPAELSAPLPSAPLARKSQPARPLPLTSLGPILRSREKIRQAIILREVLGPPRGLEPFGQFQGL